MIRKFRALLLALTVAVTGLGTAGTATVFAAYTTNCSGTNISGNTYHAYLDRQSIQVLDGVASIAYLRDTGICTGTNGQSWVFPVNLQGATNMCAVQIGWGRATGTSGLQWWITKRDDNCVVSVPSGWPVPVVGHSYTLRVFGAECVPGTNDWEYSMHDNTAGGTYTYCGSRFSLGVPNELWAGFEVHDNSDQLGGAGTAQTIADMGYAACAGCTYTYLTTTTLHIIGTTQSYWHPATGTDPDGSSKITAYTSSH